MIRIDITLQQSGDLTNWVNLMTFGGVWSTQYQADPPTFYRCFLNSTITNFP